MDSIPQKRCYDCKQKFPATSDFFSKNASKKDGFVDACKTCDSARRKAHREAHKEQDRINRKFYRDTHKEEIFARKKLYRETHKEEIAAHKKEWQQSESYKEYQKRYHQEHIEDIHIVQRQRYQGHREESCKRQQDYNKTERGRLVSKANRQKRKAQKRASKGSYTATELQEQYNRQRGKCYYCKKKLGKIWHADHVVPLARGGSNDISNIVASCPTCNMRKKAKLLHEWPEGNRLL